jgi:hypothetical protein
MHLLASHEDGEHVRRVAAKSGLDLALLRSYRFARARSDGLFLRYGALDSASLQAGIQSLVSAAYHRGL